MASAKPGSLYRMNGQPAPDPGRVLRTQGQRGGRGRGDQCIVWPSWTTSARRYAACRCSTISPPKCRPRCRVSINCRLGLHRDLLLIFAGRCSGLLDLPDPALTVLGLYLCCACWASTAARISLAPGDRPLVDNAIVANEGILVGRQRAAEHSGNQRGPSSADQPACWAPRMHHHHRLRSHRPVRRLHRRILLPLAVPGIDDLLLLSWVTAITLTPFFRQPVLPHSPDPDQPGSGRSMRWRDLHCLPCACWTSPSIAVASPSGLLAVLLVAIAQLRQGAPELTVAVQHTDVLIDLRLLRTIESTEQLVANWIVTCLSWKGDHGQQQHWSGRLRTSSTYREAVHQLRPAAEYAPTTWTHQNR